ncbi:MAG: hypothetical protein WD556_10780 [Actinomycetota bacterium]
MRIRPVPSITAILAIAMILLAAAPASAGITTGSVCRVRNVTQATMFGSPSGQALTDAIEAADAGDTLRIRGTCVGSFTLDKNLTLIGRRSLDKPTILDGGGAGRVIAVDVGTSATIRRLVVTGGSSGVGGGGGINVSEGARLNLRASLVAKNEATNVGGGIVNGGTLRMRSSVVIRNHAGIDGGGIYNFGDLRVARSAINRNVAEGVGGGLFNEGTALLRGSAVRRNIASSGGGILNVNTLTLESTEVSDNQPDDCAC